MAVYKNYYRPVIQYRRNAMKMKKIAMGNSKHWHECVLKCVKGKFEGQRKKFFEKYVDEQEKRVLLMLR